MKAGLFIFQQRGVVDLSDPNSSVIPLKLVQSWMAEFAAAELRTVRAERDKYQTALEKIRDEDYRGHRSTASVEAYAALQGEGE
jgi:hypothetical protein